MKPGCFAADRGAFLLVSRQIGGCGAADTPLKSGRQPYNGGRQPGKPGRCPVLLISISLLLVFQAGFWGVSAVEPPDPESSMAAQAEENGPIRPHFPNLRTTDSQTPAALKRRIPVRGRLAPPSDCDKLMDVAENALGIPKNVLRAVGLTEAGLGDGTIHPWTANIAGSPRFYADQASAVDGVASAQSRGVRSIDVGCLQVNLKHHPTAFASLAEAFDPAHNVAYGAAYLAALKRQYGSWTGAVQRYHSANHTAQKRYLCTVLRRFAALGSRPDADATITREAQQDAERLCP